MSGTPAGRHAREVRDRRTFASDRGSAPLELVVVASVLLVLVLGIVQFGLWFYGRAVVTGAAVEGARAARTGDRSYAVERASTVLEAGLGQLVAQEDIKVETSEERVRVTVSAGLPSLMPFLELLRVEAMGSARREVPAGMVSPERHGRLAQ